MFSDPVEIKKAVEYEKMSEADKLFEELGYVKKEVHGMISERIAYVDSGNDDIEIVFHLDYQLIYTKNYEGITMQELKAINMKVKELGWE